MSWCPIRLLHVFFSLRLQICTSFAQHLPQSCSQVFREQRAAAANEPILSQDHLPQALARHAASCPFVLAKLSTWARPVSASCLPKAARKRILRASGRVKEKLQGLVSPSQARAAFTVRPTSEFQPHGDEQEIDTGTEEQESAKSRAGDY